MHQHLNGLTGVVSIADDIVVFGENEKHHDRNLVNLMEQTEIKGLVIQSNKCHVKQSCVSFFGNRDMSIPRSQEDI